MKLRPLFASLVLALTAPSFASAQDAAPATPPAAVPAPATVATELSAIVGKVSAKLSAGQRTAEALAPELAEFDSLLAKHPEKNDDVAQVVLMKAMLYVQVLGDEDGGKKILNQLVADYAGTKAATQAANTLAQLSPEAKAKAAAAEAERAAKLAALIGKPAPELNFLWSSKSGLKKLSELKGQVVVLDFWATWCGPCIASFPQVREHVAHFKGSPVSFLGVTSIQGSVSNMGPRIDTKGNPEKEFSLMPEFMKAKDMTWDVVFSEENVFNPDYAIRGIPYVAIIAPDGTVRHAGLHPGVPASEIAAKVEALLQEFNLPLPKAE